MKNKKRVLIIISIILLTLGVSFASWIITLNQSENNTIASKCFNLTLSEENPINLEGAYPISDEEGKTLTPFTFTINNTCSSAASYEVNLEILNTTTLASSEVKVMLDNGTPALLSSKTTITKTLDNASSSYILTTGLLDGNQSVTYNLRLWINEDSTMEASANKTFSSKVTVTAAYKAEITDQDRCEMTYGEGAPICNIIASADPTNSKCLQVDENGMIINPDSTMSDSDTPIICTMEDDYGTSYYLRGLHTTNNVKFANMCWKLVRITGTGGYKLIYNGDLDANGKCTTTSGEHTGFVGQPLSLSGNKVYGTSYAKGGSTYTLTDTSTMNWSTDSASIVGKYTCGDTNTSCTNLYYVVSKEDDTTGYVLKMGVSNNYAQIGTSAFNSSDNSPSYVGYMYNDVYASRSKTMTAGGVQFLSVISESSVYNDGVYGTPYYPDFYINADYYVLTGEQKFFSWNTSDQSVLQDLVGKYVCDGLSGGYVCTTLYKVLDVSMMPNRLVVEEFTNGETAKKTIKISNNYIDNGDGTYTLGSPVEELTSIDWYRNSSSFNNYYICEDYDQTTCSNLYKILDTSLNSIVKRIGVFNNYYYGESFTYNNGTYTLNNTVQFFDINDSTNQASLNTHHYTCFKASDNTCSEMYYIYLLSDTTPYYIKLNGNETISDALDKMLRNNNINVKDSHIKGVIDYWYKENILGTQYEDYLEDTVFCNDRTIDDIGGWSETGTTLYTLKFNAYNKKYYLKCPNKRDAFTVSDETYGNSALTYPVGLLTTTEHSLTGNYTVNNTRNYYWSSAPSYFYNYGAYERRMYSSGDWDSSYNVHYNQGVRPSISLKPGTKFVVGGDGSASNPYEVDMTN